MKLTKFFIPALVLVALVLAAVPSMSLAQGPDTPDSIFPLPLDHPAAPFLETQAYAQSVGATAEWRKMEGVAIDEANGYIYLAMSEIGKSMADEEGDVRLEENICGIVYQAKLDENYNISNMKPLIVGGPYSDDPNNECDVNGMANPDAVHVDPMGRVWIGEDTGNHENNVLWMFDPADGSLKRFATVPVGAEVTGLKILEDGTVFFNVQHPSPRALYPYNRGVVGVVVGVMATDDWEEVPVPEGQAKLTVQVPAGATYVALGRVGDPIPNAPHGEAFGEVIRADGSTQFFCNDPDGNMPLMTTADEGYLYTNFECRPGAVSKLLIQRDDMGMWHAIEGEKVDFVPVNGTWNNCNASVTPWNTGLTSEEYPDENSDYWASGSSSGAMGDYLGRSANAYDYGYIVELIPAEGVGTNVIKHYAMGRFSMEQAQVMPDGKTAYYGDDGTDRILYKFVAEDAGDLGYGTLYAAQVTQLEDDSFDIAWIELGVGDNLALWDTIRSLDPFFEG